MRPAGRGPLESLYFDYPDFSLKKVPEMAGESQTHPVAIVGAGPIGMAAALTLAQFGIKSVLLEAKNTFNDGSRATCIARQSFQILQQVGAVEPFVKKSLGWTLGRSFYRGREIYQLEMPHSSHEKYMPMYNLEQQYLEQFLWQAVDQRPEIDMRWLSEVTGLEQDEDGVTLTVATPQGDYGLSARYLLAADGAHSPVRGMLGLRLKGENHEGKYVIVDVCMEHDYPTERRALFDPASNPGGTVLIHKQPDNIWRIDFQLKPGEDEKRVLKEENIQARIAPIIREIGHDGTWELEWWSTYTANTLCLEDYRHGRVFFIGDSAHIVPIFGVRGLNNGLADAQNIGWKLAYVLSGEADGQLLESYSAERRGATLDVFANATKSTRFMTPPTRGYRLAREAALSLALSQDFAREFANPRQMQPYVYADSPLTPYQARDKAFDAGPVSGCAAPNVKLGETGFLLDHAGAGFSALIFLDGAADAAVDDLVAQLAGLDKRFTPIIVACQGTKIDGVTLEDGSGDIAKRYNAAPGTVYLLRPDLHIAGRWQTCQAAEILDTLAINLGGRTP